MIITLSTIIVFIMPNLVLDKEKMEPNKNRISTLSRKKKKELCVYINQRIF